MTNIRRIRRYFFTENPLLWLVVSLFFAGCGSSVVVSGNKQIQLDDVDPQARSAYRDVQRFLDDSHKGKLDLGINRYSAIDTILMPQGERLDVHFNAYFSREPLRTEMVSDIYHTLEDYLGRRYRKMPLTLFSEGYPIEDLVPNYYRPDTSEWDRGRLPRSMRPVAPLVRNLSKPTWPLDGLQDRYIALWPSHGWYYDHTEQRWEWQRARIYQTVEDLLPMAFCIPYLVPMLENAGGQVLMPRERDLQRREVIVDNDGSSTNSQYSEKSLQESLAWGGDSSGFAIGTPPYGEGLNPFNQGSFRYISTTESASAYIDWAPRINAGGNYAVYVSYRTVENSVNDARYSVYHAGGRSDFQVNQQIGGSTWIYLGTFRFRSGSDPRQARVRLTNASGQKGVVTADAVRFGGGMGNIERGGQSSGRPRFTEGARYYMQYAGMPDTLVYNVAGPQNDYKDDYRGRGEWVNYLRGAPYGPKGRRNLTGLGIPIDLSLAFHTDAGSTGDERTFGTLMIYSDTGSQNMKSFPDGVSRLSSRDFSDILQTEIVSDIRRLYDPNWRRRALWNSDYSEVVRPNVPSALLELLSHHNYADMRLALDPRFRFDISRSIYKGMLKYLATQYNRPYRVQPLPVSHARLSIREDGALQLDWRAVPDPLEPDAMPDQYIVYTRIAGGGFNNGVIVEKPQYVIQRPRIGRLYSFKVTAVNSGGESFPSETLSACLLRSSDKPVLVINGFDRVAPPATIDHPDFAGFANFIDEGVPDGYDLSYIGQQYSFDRRDNSRGNDAPGHGASHGDMETFVIPGNRFDYPFLHGISIREAGFSFISVSDEAVIDDLVDLNDFPAIDLILGEERLTPHPYPGKTPQFEAYPPELQVRLRDYLQNGGAALVSGAYVATDLCQNKPEDHADRVFARDVLRLKWRTNFGTRKGLVNAVDTTLFKRLEQLTFNTAYHPYIYRVEAPDAFDAAGPAAKTVLRYQENNLSAAIRYQENYRLLVCGFPFETILSASDRHKFMDDILSFLLPDEARSGE